MLQFLYPLGLLAAAGMIIPVIVHLWNIKNGKTLKIGSISLLGDPSNQRSSNLRITNWPLLLVRCLLISLMALLLAQPLYELPPTAMKQPGWILLEKGNLNTVWDSKSKQLDSLLRKGYELHDFNIGFTKLELRDTATVFSVSAKPPLSYFSLIRQLNTRLAAGSSVYLYTGNRLERFRGTQPYSNVDLKWTIVPPLVKPGDRETAVEEGENAMKLTAEAGKMAADTSKLEVLFFEGNNHQDAIYLRAALNAIADFTGRKIGIRNIQSFSQITKQANLVFWLSERTISPAQFRQLPAGISFFNYAGGKIKKVKSVLHDLSATSLQDVSLYQRISYEDQSGTPLWVDGYGVPLLTVDSSSTITHFQFYSRFNQEWTDLVWTNELVMTIMPLVIPSHSGIGFQDDKIAERTIVKAPQLSAGIHGVTAVSSPLQPLSNMLWWLVLALFLIERLMVYQKQQG